MKNLNEIAEKAAIAISNYRKNSIIMDFVTAEAREKVASEIRSEMGGGTTAKAVELLEMRYKNISDRVKNYIEAGLLGCYMAAA